MAVVVVATLVLVLLPPWLGARDVLSYPPDAWQAAGLSRVGWLLVVVLVPVLGPATYLRRARPQVRAQVGRTRR